MEKLLSSGPHTLKGLAAAGERTGADVTLLIARLDKPQGYGRICRDIHGSIRGIIEEAEANTEKLKIKEINVGILCI